MTRRRRMRCWTPPDRTTAAMAVAIAAAAVLGWPRPAQADPKGGCPLGRICLYSERGYTGEKLEIDPAADGGGTLREGEAAPCSTLDAPVWSATNRTGPRASTPRYRAVLFRTADCGGPAASVGPEAARADTGGSRSFRLECIERDGCGRRARVFP